MSGTVRSSGTSAIRSRLVQLGFVAVILTLWFLATTEWGVNQLLLPNPVSVWYQLLDVVTSGEFIPDLIVTCTELTAAFAISVLFGVTLGYLISRSPFLIKVFEPLFAGVYAAPISLFLPLYVLILGLGPASKIALGATISFFPIIINTIAGFSTVDPTLTSAARSSCEAKNSAPRCLRPGRRSPALTGWQVRTWKRRAKRHYSPPRRAWRRRLPMSPRG